jgi:hypothetical protein
LSDKIIIFKTFYNRGKNYYSSQMDLSKLLNIQQEERENLTQGEIQALYIYLSMQFENMTDDQKALWIETMKTLDPEFDDYEED